VSESTRVQVLRQAYSAFNRGVVDGFMDLLDEHVELRPPPTSVEPEPLRGREAVREYLAPNMFEFQTADPQEIDEEGDRILVVAHVRARGRGSGIEVDDTVFHVWTVVGDRVVRFDVYTDRDQALAAFRNESGAR
jgi:ketosteroid isomerase-like protein